MKGHGRFALAAAIFLLWSTAALAATRNWTGASSIITPPGDPFWTNALNWSGGVAPMAGDDLVFNGGPPSVNTFQAGTTFNLITINGHVISDGAAIALNAGISGTGAQINLVSITLNASQAFTATAANSGLTFISPIVTNGRTLTLNGPGAFVLVGAISGSGGITKDGSGSLQFAGNHSYTGDTTINDGPVRIAGQHSGSRFVSFSGPNALIGGAGTVKGMSASDPVDPGAANNGTGILASVGDLNITTEGELLIDIKGTTPGTQFDQLQVTGAVIIDLALALGLGAGLNIELVGFTPTPGDSFPIIVNDGTDPIGSNLDPGGAFINALEGRSLVVPNSSGGNTTFFITYKGGDGNDVVLHVPTTRTWDGGGANGNWRTAANWVGDIAPNAGDDLVFPGNTARLSNTNNFPASTKFNSIALSGGYIIGGNAIVLQAGITSTGNSSHSVNLAEIKLDANQSFSKSGQGSLVVSANIDTNGKILTLLGPTTTGTHQYRGIISGAGGINMAALNTAIIEGSQINTFTGPTVISSGIFTVHSRQPGSPVQLTGGRLLGRLGEVGTLTATGGTIFPFFGGPTTLGISGNLNLNSAATLEISFADDSSGAAVGSKLEVAGAVDLGGSTLVLNSFFAAPQTGDEVTIIDNDGTDPVVGTFGSLPEGAFLTFGNATVQITYQGGDGNDVVLRITAVAPVGIGLVKLTNGTDNDAPPGPALPVGSTVTFHYVVTNTGGTPLEGVFVEDDNGTPGIPSDDFNAAFNGGDTNSNGLLDPSETFTFAAGRIATEGQHTNIGEAQGRGLPFGPTVTASNADNHFGGTPPPSTLANISTRLRVQAGDNALIGGVIATGTTDKQVIIRAIGPTLTDFGLPGALQDPTLELFQGNLSIASNDDWVSSSQAAEISESGLAPGNNAESAIIATLTPNQNYTAVVRGKDGETGVGVVEVFDLDQAAPARLANISTRGVVEVDDNVMIAGLIVGPSGTPNINVLVRALGPTLGDFGVQGFLANPTLDLVSSNGTVIRSNDDWKSDQRSEIEAAQLAPTHDAEAALIQSLSPGAYTAVVRGNSRTTGVGLVEVYNIP